MLNNTKIIKYNTTFKRNNYQGQQETSSHIHYLKFTFEGPEYSRNVVFL